MLTKNASQVPDDMLFAALAAEMRLAGVRRPLTRPEFEQMKRREQELAQVSPQDLVACRISRVREVLAAAMAASNCSMVVITVHDAQVG